MDAVDSFIMHQNQKKDSKRQREISAKAYRAEQGKKIHILEYLFGLGHRHIAYLNGLGKEMSNDLRYVGYKKMVENLKLLQMHTIGGTPAISLFSRGTHCGMKVQCLPMKISSLMKAIRFVTSLPCSV